MIRIWQIVGDDAVAKTTTDGFLEIEGAVVARAGVLEYKTGDGRKVRELRDPSVIHSNRALASYEGRPVLLGRHPTNDNGQVTLATDDNIKSLPVIGSMRNVRADYATDSNGRRHRVTKADVLIWDTDGINAARSGVRQFSVGYRTATELSKGTYDGDTYDARQMVDEGNHLVLTATARAGDVTEFRLDDRDAVVLTTATEGGDMASYTIDGVEGEIADDLAPLVDQKMKQLEALEAELSAIREEHANMSSERERLATRVAELEAKIADMDNNGDMSNKSKEDDMNDEKKGDATAGPTKSVDELVANRLDLVERARDLIGKSYEWSNKTERQIRADAISAVMPALDINGLTDAEVVGAYLVAVEQHKSSTTTQKTLADATRGDGATDNNKTSARERALRWYTDRSFRMKGGN